ncbi:uncharacterized protein BXZ73DRAFT_103378 [Epithele typhae]|uniref:uncharacterized protein n=1 Tax=Epithele typhae TaxID=378194 RepID=UPI0020080172|nr:uncharacterized protein BXZ73DRAFT_103378 [Epithele typhae]KAH9925000.1 hypothetical protein BXZ73DRAFT_103378 [Epithele typhae]
MASLSGITVFRADSYSATAASALLIYEYVITFPTEVNLYWPAWRKPTGALVLFALNRYLALGHCIYNLFFEWFATTASEISRHHVNDEC